VNAGNRHILLNLQGVSYVDSSGLGEMAGSYVTVAKLGDS
jgi:anti-anti-sigma regulatory factor